MKRADAARHGALVDVFGPALTVRKTFGEAGFSGRQFMCGTLDCESARSRDPAQFNQIRYLPRRSASGPRAETHAGLAADIRHRHSVSALLQNKRLLGVRKLRCFHGLRSFPARKSARKTLPKNGPVWRPQITLPEESLLISLTPISLVFRHVYFPNFSQSPRPLARWLRQAAEERRNTCACPRACSGIPSQTSRMRLPCTPPAVDSQSFEVMRILAKDGVIGRQLVDS